MIEKVAIITGANNPYGIGAGVATALAAAGVQVFLHGYSGGWKGSRPKIPSNDSTMAEVFEPGEEFYYRQGRKPLDEVLGAIRATGGQAEGLEGDLADTGLVTELFDLAETAFGPVNVLVNNAAHWEGDSFIPAGQDQKNEAVEMWTGRPPVISAGSFDRLFAVNTRTPALMMAEFARRHVNRGDDWGRIINISTAGAYVFPSEVSYGACKLALEGYTRSAAVELGQFGITVNCLAPGPVQSGYITPQLEEHILPTIPMGRLGTPDDIAQTIEFLASDKAGWLTGQRIFVGGGHGM